MVPVLAGLGVGLLSSYVLVHWTARRQRQSARAMAARNDELRDAMEAVARELHDRVEREARLAHEAAHDHLTGLANRSNLMVELERATARARRSGTGFGVLFVDLDRFKVVNDTLGHRAGDVVLISVAERLVAATRDTDFVARNGGDEFVVIAEDAADIATVVRLAERIQMALSGPVVLGLDTVHVTASIGVTWLAPDADDDIDHLRDADLAMYQAKSTGPGQIRVFDDAMRLWVEQRFDLERELRRAVDRDELGVHVQPVIDLRTGQVSGAELLCRWTLANGDEIPPTDFIALAEDSSLVVDIGRQMLDRAAGVLADWGRDPRLAEMVLSVNLSGRHVDHPGVVDDVASALRRWDVDADRLTIELTETTLVRDLGEAATTLRALRDVGVAISVDDFGVGHASLRYLRELPVALVKIDRSIVAGFERVDSDTVIVTMLTRLADVLEIDIVAEGIETEEQLERLADAGCRFAQGHLFARSMPVADFRAWITAWDREHTHPARWHELV